MFETWKRCAPKEPAQGWFGSLYWEGKKYKAPIEDYGSEGQIEVIGIACLNEDGSQYNEKYY